MFTIHLFTQHYTRTILVMMRCGARMNAPASLTRSMERYAHTITNTHSLMDKQCYTQFNLSNLSHIHHPCCSALFVLYMPHVNKATRRASTIWRSSRSHSSRMGNSKLIGPHHQKRVSSCVFVVCCKLFCQQCRTIAQQFHTRTTNEKGYNFERRRSSSKTSCRSRRLDWLKYCNLVAKDRRGKWSPMSLFVFILVAQSPSHALCVRNFRSNCRQLDGNCVVKTWHIVAIKR